MPLSPDERPSFDEVHAWFSDTLTPDALDGYLALLRADPNWLVQIASAPLACSLRLYYYPLGEWLTVVLHDEGGQWRPDHVSHEA